MSVCERFLTSSLISSRNLPRNSDASCILLPTNTLSRVSMIDFTFLISLSAQSNGVNES